MAAKADDKKAEMEQRRHRALQLRRAGRTFREIGDINGTSHETARKDVNAALDRLVEETNQEAEKLRALETARLERALTKVTSEIENATEYPRDAIRDLVKLSESLRKLHGIDEPERVEHSHELDPDEAADRISALLGLHQPEDTEDG